MENKMKVINLIIVSFLLFSCAGNKENTINPQTVKAQGGVDVGNMSSSVPQTNAYFELIGNWKSKIEGNLLILENASFSKIEAQKVNLDGLSSLTTEDLIAHLKVKYPDREYKPIKLNELAGVRAELTNTNQTRSSDIYLIAEGKDLIHVATDLKDTDDGFTEGEKIISTVRVKFKGVAFKNSSAITVNFNHQKENKLYKYSVTHACWSSEVCSGSMIEVKDYSLSVSGNIVELGYENDIPFDSIQVDSEFLIAPNSKFPISDIYADDRGQSSLRMKEGFIYLIRIDDGPEAGLIIKFVFYGDILLENMEFTFQKLVAVKPEAKP